MKYFSINNRRYLGSKYKLLPFIHKVVDENCSEVSSVFDVFAGTGVVGYSFNSKAKIYVNDILASNQVIYYTFFSDEEFDVRKIMDLITEYNEKETKEDNYYSEKFGGTYLSVKNMKKVGFIRDDIDKLYREEKLNFRERCILITSLIYGIDKIANTVGHYDAYRKGGNLDKKLEMGFPEVPYIEENTGNKIFREDANELVKHLEADLVYIDPPYNSRQYGDCYHFLENLVENKKPDVEGKARKMNRDGLKSEYCTKEAPKAFKELIEEVRGRYILVSYNNTGKGADERSNARISEEEILDILGRRGKVKVFEEEYKAFTTGKTKMEGHKEKLYLVETDGNKITS